MLDTEIQKYIRRQDWENAAKWLDRAGENSTIYLMERLIKKWQYEIFVALMHSCKIEQWTDTHGNPLSIILILNDQLGEVGNVYIHIEHEYRSVSTIGGERYEYLSSRSIDIKYSTKKNEFHSEWFNSSDSKSIFVVENIKKLYIKKAFITHITRSGDELGNVVSRITLGTACEPVLLNFED